MPARDGSRDPASHGARSAEPPARRTSRLRALLHRPTLGFLMEAHDGLSAKVAEEAGFEGIWASSFATAAALGVRDANEASWTQVLEVAEFMADVAALWTADPLDADWEPAAPPWANASVDGAAEQRETACS